MEEPSFYIDIFLQPGEFYFGDCDTRIRTILGSCVAITMWHPEKKIGGMCHYMLPKHNRNAHKSHLDGKYAEDAMQMFLHEIKVSRTHTREYEVKIFGGGNQFPHHEQSIFTISDKNIDMGHTLLRQHNFKVKSQHLGGDGHRNIMFELWSGDVWVKHVEKGGLP
ncbi:MAG: chemotaxis protein CheD [Undibacterium sp.]|nr:chemotaxis protein CheD [Undibacterium sp.]